MENVQGLTGILGESIKSQFLSRRYVMSFQDYLQEVVKYPTRHMRNCANYFTDLVEHFGVYQVALPTGHHQRYKLFDAPFDHGEGQVLGHEQVQGEIVRLLQNFVRAGRVDRLVMLHGPNGSAKTSLVQALTRAAEVYSETDEGALYRFNWVFPLKKAFKGGLGFSGELTEESHSFAYLSGEELECRIPCEHKDHPLLLLPLSFRQNLFQSLIEKGFDKDFVIPDVLRKGDLSPKNKKIFDALLTGYHGDIQAVLKHVQVQRFYLSRRYRTGIAAVEPQMSVDAYARQVTADQSFASLPPMLQHMALYETGGPLTEANRGVIEYNDLLKRPIESWKYLLVATEQAQASVDVVSVFLDLLMIATSNELHLNSFREYPDWQSFKGRFELVKVPYLRRYSDEVKIYTNQIPRALAGMHIAPHALEVAAKWAVLTRLEPPLAENYPEAVRDLVRNLAPVEKMELYDKGIVPERLSQKEAKELRQILPKLYHEFDNELDYEGRYGASAREIRTLILNASQDKRFDHLSVFAVLDQIKALLKERSSYEFLRRDPIRGYRDPASFLALIEQDLHGQLAQEMRVAIGLVDAKSHVHLFERYLKHVSAWTKNEKMLDVHTGKMVSSDVSTMNMVEKVLLAKGETPEEFRRSLISQIGAFRLERPEEDVDYEMLFMPYLRRLEEDYYLQQKRVIERIEAVFLRLLENDVTGIEEKELQQAEQMRRHLHAKGYNDASAQQAIAFLLRSKV